ncbi:MAG: peptidase T [Rikenellaceae bacterium]
MNTTERFLKYVTIDTTSNPESESFPSSAKQFDLLNLLCRELSELGLSEVKIDEYGYVSACLKSNTTAKVPTLAFIAHVDTSPEVSGTNVKPQITHYTGGELKINDTLSIAESRLKDYIGDNIITSDGTTLLGADDKAGVAEIMSAMEFLVNNPDVAHGDIKVLFTPDEEIGKGVDFMDIAALRADYGYTVDGGECGSLEWETFNAAAATVTFKGINFHPGYAKGAMINAQVVALEFQNIMPQEQTPERTELREGFFHLTHSEGSVESCTLNYIIRDHDSKKFEQRKELMRQLTEQINAKWGENLVEICIKDQYYNMGEVIKNHFICVEIAEKAMKSLGIEPKISAIRGGTDGSRLSFMGLPCPNIFTGAENIHSRLEFVSERVMSLSVKTVIKIVDFFYQKSLEV